MTGKQEQKDYYEMSNSELDRERRILDLAYRKEKIAEKKAYREMWGSIEELVKGGLMDRIITKMFEAFGTKEVVR